MNCKLLLCLCTLLTIKATAATPEATTPEPKIVVGDTWVLQRMPESISQKIEILEKKDGVLSFRWTNVKSSDSKQQGLTGIRSLNTKWAAEMTFDDYDADYLVSKIVFPWPLSVRKKWTGKVKFKNRPDYVFEYTAEVLREENIQFNDLTKLPTLRIKFTNKHVNVSDPKSTTLYSHDTIWYSADHKSYVQFIHHGLTDKAGSVSGEWMVKLTSSTLK